MLYLLSFLILALYVILSKFYAKDVIFKSIDKRPGNYLKAGIAEDGAYILQPVTGNYDQINIIHYHHAMPH